MANISEQERLIEESRANMHQRIDRQYDALLEALRSGQPLKTQDEKYALTTAPSIFKGEKPTSVTLPNGEMHPTKTWRELIQIVLQDCNSDENRHERMMQLSGCTSGRSRRILSGTPEGMNVPLKIDDNLFFEGYFDTEYLLKMLVDRVLEPAGYECEKVSVNLRQKEINVADMDEADIAEDSGMSMCGM